MRLILGDCIDKLKELDDNSVDSIVTDPPYGLSFMGKDWDKKKATQETKSQVVKGLGAGMKMTTLADNIEFEKWVTEWASECMRVLKPGGYMLAFGGSRMYHRLASGVENAGFEIRDQIMWIYGSGFPKSHNIGKAVDKLQGNDREIIGKDPNSKGRTMEREYIIGTGIKRTRNEFLTKGNSPYEGWGTALKPAHEPIVMARKPLSEKTIVDNVLEWGTGGINIDDSRIGTEQRTYKGMSSKKPEGAGTFRDDNWVPKDIENTVEGRFPANIIFDEEAGKILDEQSGLSKSTGGRSGNKEGIGLNGIYGDYKGIVTDENPGFGDIGGASRFFYCPKTSKTDRNEGLEHLPISRPDERTETGMGSFVDKGIQPQQNIHPTVKPTDLMLYLIRLVTPKGGTTLDPFMGSGSTGKAAVRGGFDFVGVEMDKEYKKIAEARIQYEIDNPYNEEKGERIKINKNANKFW